MSDKDIHSATPAVRPPDWDITPEEFEELTAGLLQEAMGEADGFKIERHTVLPAADGTYDIDATVRFEVGGIAFLVLVEAKRHKNPIKRELVTALHQKMQSTGAQKGILVSTAAFQSGAIDFAQAHGIALATVVSGRLHLESKADPSHRACLGRGAAAPGIPALVARLVGLTPGAELMEPELFGTERLGYLISTVFPDLTQD
jgi:hypothetical protein